ncbi:MAG: ferrochelatase [Thermoplasmataceae archaeon]
MIHVILMAYGSPTRMEDVPEYLQGIYEGKPVPEYATKENTEKYAMVGGISPSNAIVESLVSKISARLSRVGEVDVILGNKHWKPWLDQSISALSIKNTDKIVAFPLFPFPSAGVQGSYLDPLEKALSRRNLKPEIKFINGIPSDILAGTWVPIVKRHYHAGDAVLFDAHSLPLFRGEENDYNAAFMSAARITAEEAGLQEYFAGYQSRGKYGNRWLEPSIYEVLEKIKAKGYRSLLAVPIGFLYEHLEILYDLDLEFGEKVKETGMDYHRTGLPDDGDSFVDSVCRLVMDEVS